MSVVLISPEESLLCTVPTVSNNLTFDLLIETGT